MTALTPRQKWAVLHSGLLGTASVSCLIAAVVYPGWFWYYLGIGVTGLGLAARAWKRVRGEAIAARRRAAGNGPAREDSR